jgi:hypothetical protein
MTRRSMQFLHHRRIHGLMQSLISHSVMAVCAGGERRLDTEGALRGPPRMQVTQNEWTWQPSKDSSLFLPGQTSGNQKAHRPPG